MRPLALFSIAGAVAWAGLSFAVVGQHPEVAVHAEISCPGAEAWRQALADADFAVVPSDPSAVAAYRARAAVPESLVSCQTAQVAGYLIEGAVPPQAVSDLLREHPRAVTAVAVKGGALVALRRDGSIVPLQEALDD